VGLIKFSISNQINDGIKVLLENSHKDFFDGVELDANEVKIQGVKLTRLNSVIVVVGKE
jgi:hypothetical protein